MVSEGEENPKSLQRVKAPVEEDDTMARLGEGVCPSQEMDRCAVWYEQNKNKKTVLE